MSLTKANRDINNLAYPFKDKVKKFLEDKRIKNKVFITEWYRSQERQNYLYQQWRTRKWPIVTWTLNSNHTKWTAIDIAFHWNELYPTDHNKWKEVWEVANQYWIDWGYDLWQRDKPHFQDNWKPLKISTETSTQNDLSNKYEDILINEIMNGYRMIFNNISWEEYLKEKEIKTLMEIWFARLEKRILQEIEK